MKKKKTIKNILAHTVLTILAIVWVSPLFWILLTSFRAQKGAYTSSFFPKQYSLDNYVKLFTDTGILNFPRMFTNTLIVAVFSCIISTFFVLSVAYCMSRLKFKMRKAMMNIAMILGLFPAFMAMVAVYYILKAVGLSEGAMIRVALVLVYSASSGIQFYIAKGFFDTIQSRLLRLARPYPYRHSLTHPLAARPHHADAAGLLGGHSLQHVALQDRKSTRLNSSH